MRGRKLSRRSFLARVAGGAIIGGGALAVIAEPASAHPISDNDPTDAVGAGRGTGTWPYSDVDEGQGSDPAGRAGRLGHYTDTDRGATADRAQHGRRITDRDPGDPANYRRTVTDRDAAPNADPPGRGRRVPRR